MSAVERQSRVYRSTRGFPNAVARSRIQSVDALRGFVMILMALDHVRDFFHVGAMSFQPDDLSQTTTAIFLTRWITHICAPVFAFTAGVGAFLWMNRGHSQAELSRFLWTRGLWLVLLELIAVRFAMFFSFTNSPIILTVLWSLGWSMVILGIVARAPLRVLAFASVGFLVLHNLADNISPSVFGSFGWLWNLLRQPGLVRFGGTALVTPYPILSWAAVLIAGYSFGPIILMDPEQRQKWLMRLGLVLTSAFLVVRFLNVYGDPQPWSTQTTFDRTVLSFLRCTKYPPSLAFLLMTLGPAMLILSWFDRLNFSRYNPLIVFGRVPLFYFIAHLFLAHALTYVFAFARYGTVEFLQNPLPSMGGSAATYPPGFGYNLPVVYAVWILVVAALYPACLYLSRLKARGGKWWLSYI